MSKIRANIHVNGIVQGVGFRPFIHKQITDHSLLGWIRNTSSGAEIEIEGTEERVDLFIEELRTKSPKLSLIETVTFEKFTELKNYTEFEIIKSKAEDSRDTLISPDVCVCDDCIREMFDSKDRRFRYPFINCTNCGPRFTIIKDIPYDRDKTTMQKFPMCQTCEKEYKDIVDRRYHAQPVACEKCGPEVFFVENDSQSIIAKKDDAIKIAQQFLKDEKIIAIKGLGGIHLACNANNERLVNELRKRKHRDEKPFALMVKDIEAAKEICEISDDEEKILTSHQRAIVLLKKKDLNSYMHISENNYIGVMLPYTPVHFLVFEDCPKRLVMTSANISDLPIIYKNEETLEKLKNVADGFLLNNRDIETRCDDSLCWVFEGKEYFARRSRGFVPFPIILKELIENSKEVKNVLACGAEQKATFALSKNSYVFPSAHIGDLKNIETLEHYENQIKHFEKMFSIKPEVIACDLHLDYLSSIYAKQRAKENKIKIVEVQHHFAHMASCMADNNLDEKVIGIIWDGTGLGTDNTIWGAEFFVGDYEGFERKGTILPFKLPGGDKATKEIYRCAVSLLKTSNADTKKIKDAKLKENLEQLITMMDANINSPTCTSMGRLFDGVAYLIGIKDEATYEGQAAVLLEACALRAKEFTDEVYDYDIIETDKIYFDYTKMINQIINDEASQNIKALKFMNTVVDMAVEISKKIRQKENINKIVLSGGTMQNQYMLKRLTDRLKEEGFEPFHHKRVSTNDESLALGQVMIAMRK